MTATNNKANIRLRIQFILSHFNRVGHLMRKDKHLCKKDNLAAATVFVCVMEIKPATCTPLKYKTGLPLASGKILMSEKLHVASDSCPFRF